MRVVEGQGEEDQVVNSQLLRYSNSAVLFCSGSRREKTEVKPANADSPAGHNRVAVKRRKRSSAYLALELYITEL